MHMMPTPPVWSSRLMYHASSALRSKTMARECHPKSGPSPFQHWRQRKTKRRRRGTRHHIKRRSLTEPEGTSLDRQNWHRPIFGVPANSFLSNHHKDQRRQPSNGRHGRATAVLGFRSRAFSRREKIRIWKGQHLERKGDRLGKSRHDNRPDFDPTAGARYSPKPRCLRSYRTERRHNVWRRAAGYRAASLPCGPS